MALMTNYLGPFPPGLTIACCAWHLCIFLQRTISSQFDQLLGSRSECPIQGHRSGRRHPPPRPKAASVPALIPSSARAPSARFLWVVVAGWVIRLLASPRLFEMRTISSAFWKAKAASLPPFSSRQDQRRAAGSSGRANDIGLRVVLAPRIDDAPDLRVIAQVIGNGCGTFGLLAHAKTGSVSSPFRSVHGVEGRKAPARCGGNSREGSRRSTPCRTGMTPPRQRPWPSMCLVAE